KLSRDGLWPRFRLGAFGDDHIERAELVRLACRRAAVNGSPCPPRVILVGDTENDILAARAGGALAVAVATGGSDLEELAAAGPDHLLPGLEPAARFLREVLA